MVRLCTIDLDGTLFDKDKNISDENKKAIQMAKENGCKIVLASGRPFQGILPTLKQLNLCSKEDYVICYNGAKILNVGTLNEISRKEEETTMASWRIRASGMWRGWKFKAQ